MTFERDYDTLSKAEEELRFSLDRFLASNPAKEGMTGLSAYIPTRAIG
jgi:hypothetical protein